MRVAQEIHSPSYGLRAPVTCVCRRLGVSACLRRVFPLSVVKVPWPSRRCQSCSRTPHDDCGG